MRMSQWPKSLLNLGYRGKVKVNAETWVLPARVSAHEENGHRKGDGGVAGASVSGGRNSRGERGTAGRGRKAEPTSKLLLSQAG